MNANHPVRRWRESQCPKVTLAALAGEVGVTASHLSEVERGLDSPSLGLTKKLKGATGLPAAEINPALASLLDEAAE